MTITEVLSVLHLQLDRLLETPEPDTATWSEGVVGIARSLQSMTEANADGLLCLLMNESVRNLDRYSSHHALECATIVALCAPFMNYSAPERDALVLAALTMNISMVTLQNELVHRDRTPTLDQRRVIAEHPALSVQALQAAGVSDALWLELVEHHHGNFEAARLEGSSTRAQDIVTLLRRVDIFTAKISPRANRRGVSPTEAARHACLGADGKPDDIGIAIIKALGIHPPGSFVMLQSGALGIVIRRGARAHQPIVAVIEQADRRTMAKPAIQATSQPGNEIKSFARMEQVRARFAPADISRMIELCLQSFPGAAQADKAPPA